MKEMDKYYKPEIEEFHIGFEYEYFEPVNNKGWVKNEIFGASDFEDLHDELKPTAYRPIRVKHPDQEDIEGLGFKQTDPFGFYTLERLLFNNDRFLYKRTTNFLDYYIQDLSLMDIVGKRPHFIISIWNKETMTREEDKVPHILFNGIIKNKSEFKKVIQQLGIK